MFRFLHAADIHLDSPLSGLEAYQGAPADQIRGATRRALENLVDKAVELKVAFLLIAGDVYDGDWKDFNTGLFFSRQMGRLREAGIRVYLITGNHDAASVITRQLRLPDNVRLLSSARPESVVVDGIGVVVHGRGFDNRQVLQNVVPDYPAAIAGAFNIGLLHTSLAGSAVHDPYAPCSVADLHARGYQYWALGHIHQRNSDQQDPQWDMPIVYPGNLQGRHVGETGAKGAVLVTVDDRLRTTLEFVPLDVFRWERIEVDVSDCADLDEAVVAVGQRLQEAARIHAPRGVACRITLTGRTRACQELAGQRERLTASIRDLRNHLDLGEVWIERIRLEVQPQVSWDELLDDDGPIATLHKVLETWRRDPRAAMAGAANLASLAGELAVLGDIDPSLAEVGQAKHLESLLDEVEHLLLDRIAPRQEDAGA